MRQESTVITQSVFAFALSLVAHNSTKSIIISIRKLLIKTPFVRWSAHAYAIFPPSKWGFGWANGQIYINILMSMNGTVNKWTIKTMHSFFAHYFRAKRSHCSCGPFRLIRFSLKVIVAADRAVVYCIQKKRIYIEPSIEPLNVLSSGHRICTLCALWSSPVD